MNWHKLLNCLNLMEDSYRGEDDHRTHVIAYTEAYGMIMEGLSHPVDTIVELTDVVEEPDTLCPSTCGGRAEGCKPCMEISGKVKS